MGQILTGRRSAMAWLIAILALWTALLLTAPAAAPAAGRTVVYTLHVPAMVVDNLCNGEPVVFSGDLHIREKTTPTGNGGYTVRSSTNARNLHGPGLVTGVQYSGQDTENSYAYYAAPPFPSTFSVVHWTRLESHGSAPNMYLVIVLRETIAPDGTVVPTLDRMYLTCTQPSCSATRR
jgi:hypothetical protein